MLVILASTGLAEMFEAAEPMRDTLPAGVAGVTPPSRSILALAPPSAVTPALTPDELRSHLMDISRSQFLRLFAGAGAGALALSKLGACDDAEDRTPDAPPGNPDATPADAGIDGPPIDAPVMGNCMQNGTTITMSGHAGHEMEVTAADIIAGVEKEYDIMGMSGHNHKVIVTGPMFMMLQQNLQVTVTSSVDAGHPHIVTIRCA
jgi:hypothetical protein